MAQYRKNTVAVVNGSALIDGDATAFLSNVSIGDGFIVTGHPVVYDVASVDSDTRLTLSVPFQGTTNTVANYAVHRDFTTPDNIPELSQGDIETGTIFTRAIRRIQGRLVTRASEITIDMK